MPSGTLVPASTPATVRMLPSPPPAMTASMSPRRASASAFEAALRSRFPSSKRISTVMPARTKAADSLHLRSAAWARVKARGPAPALASTTARRTLTRFSLAEREWADLASAIGQTSSCRDFRKPSCFRGRADAGAQRFLDIESAEAVGHLARAPIADRNAVDFHDRQHEGRSRRHERLARVERLGDAERPLFERHALERRELQNRAAGDPREDVAAERLGADHPLGVDDEGG